MRRASLALVGIDTALPFVLAAFVSASVLSGGMPELRHDWRIPVGAQAAGPWLASMIDGWLSIGIGEPQPYPTFYLLGLLLWPLQWFGGTFALTAVVVVTSVFLSARAASDVVRALGASRATCAAAATFAALNPWVYVKYVTGHIFMIFAYAAVLGLLAETLRERPRRWMLVVLSALSVTQIEFAIFVFVPLVVWAWRRGYRCVIAAIGFAYAPVVFGIAASYHTIRVTPYNFVWERGQSIEPLRVALLTGAAGGYGAVFDGFWPATTAVFVVALTGALGALALPRTRALVGLGLGAAVIATGAVGPIGEIYRFAVIRVPETGIFRELYDLVGLFAIAIVISFAFGLGRHRVGGTILLVAALGIMTAWLRVPPRAFFARVPPVVVPVGTTQRIAYAPFFQPLSASGRGSGVDPDAYVYSGSALPFNEALPLFPVDVALGRAAFLGDDSDLAALGVRYVAARPYLQTDYQALKFQWPYRDPIVALTQRSREIHAAPMLSLAAVAPIVATIANQPGENAEFFGDAQAQRTFSFEPTRVTNDPDVMWVDARLSFSTHPAWGTAFGGITTRSNAPLVLPRHDAWPAVLALAEGSLVDDAGRVVAVNSPTLRWLPLPERARSLRCIGRCLIALLGDPPAGAPEHASPVAARAIQIRFAAPWFAISDVPSNFAGYLRLNVRYDGGWIALRNGTVLHHRRIATIVNGWDLTGHGSRIYFVEMIAAITFLLELTGFVATIVLSFVAWRRGNYLS